MHPIFSYPILEDVVGPLVDLARVQFGVRKCTLLKLKPLPLKPIFPSRNEFLLVLVGAYDAETACPQ